MIEINCITTENFFHYVITLTFKNVHNVPSRRACLHRMGVFALILVAVYWKAMYIPRMQFLGTIKKWDIHIQCSSCIKQVVEILLLSSASGVIAQHCLLGLKVLTYTSYRCHCWSSLTRLPSEQHLKSVCLCV